MKARVDAPSYEATVEVVDCRAENGGGLTPAVDGFNALTFSLVDGPIVCVRGIYRRSQDEFTSSPLQATPYRSRYEFAQDLRPAHLADSARCRVER